MIDHLLINIHFHVIVLKVNAIEGKAYIIKERKRIKRNSKNSSLKHCSAPTPKARWTRRTVSSGTERSPETAERLKRAKGSTWGRVIAITPRSRGTCKTSHAPLGRQLLARNTTGRSVGLAPGPRLRVSLTRRAGKSISRGESRSCCIATQLRGNESRGIRENSGL